MRISVSVLTQSAESVVSQVGILIGYSESYSGAMTPRFAKFRLSGVYASKDAVIERLEKLGDAVINLNIPHADDGGLRIKLKPVYRASALAALIRRHSSPLPPTGESESAESAERNGSAVGV